MEATIKHLYEAPVITVVELKMESAVLTASQNDYSAGDAGETWSI